MTNAPGVPGQPGADTRGRFLELQSRLPALWSAVQSGAASRHTSVVVPSLSFNPEELKKIQGVSFYEERLLFTLMRLRDPRARVIYVTSQPIHPEIIEYYLDLLTGIPESHARRRLHLLCVYDASPMPLSAKILERPRLIARLREMLGDPLSAYLTCFNVTAHERELAVALGIPLNGVDPDLLELGTKSGSRKVFRSAGVELPEGTEDVSSTEALIDALSDLAEKRPGLDSAIVKLDESFAGEGNALFRYPDGLPKSGAGRRKAIASALESIEWSSESETLTSFLDKIARMGGIVEERIRGDEFHSPSVQMRIDPDGEIRIISTHEQVLGGTTGQAFLGCRFPAREEYRTDLQERAVKIARELRSRGVFSRFGIDFVTAHDAGGPWRCYAIEINLRMGGTTHPFLALQFLTGGTLDEGTGQFVTPRGERKYYFATDHLKSATYKGLLPEDFMEILALHNLHFQPSTETGVLFHMIGAISQYGKIGLTCIGNSPEQADDLYRRTVAILDHVTGGERSKDPHLSLFFDVPVPDME